MKKFLSLFMAMVMVFSMAPAVFATEDDGSIVLFDETAVTTNDSEASWGVPFETVAPGDGNITITFDDISEVVPEYRVTVDGDDVSGWQNCLYDGLPTNTYMVAEGDSILIEICTLVNGSYAPASIHFTLVYTPASESSEQEIITGTVTFENSQTAYNGKTINYTAETNGTLVLNLYPHDNVGIEYKFEVSGGMAGWYYTYEGDPTTQSAELTRGDSVEVFIATSSAFDVYVPGTVDYELIFTPAEGGGEGGGEVIDTNLELGDNEVSLAAGEMYSAVYTFIPEEDGVLSFDVTALALTSPYEGYMDVTEYIDEYLNSIIYVYVNEEAYAEPINVTAGVPVEVYLYQNRMYSNSGYAWDAVINLSMGSGEGGSTVIGNAEFIIDEGQEYSNVYTFTPEQDGFLNIEFLDLSSYSPANGDENHTEYAEVILGGSLFLYVNEESYIGTPISVTAGVPVEIYFAQVPMFVNHGYSWYAAISLSIQDPEVMAPVELYTGENFVELPENESVESVTCLHTAVQTGTLNISIPIYMSKCEGEELWGENVLEDLVVTVNGVAVESLPYSIDVTEGDVVTVEFTKIWWAGIGYDLIVELNYELGEVEPTVIIDGENIINIPEDERVTSLTAVYTATETGTVKFDIPLIMSVCDMEYEYADLFDALTVSVNDTVITAMPYTLDVNEGDVVTIVFEKNWWAGIGFQLQLMVSYELGEIEPTVLTEGENLVVIADDERIESLTATYTATKDGTIHIEMPSYKSVCDGEILDGENLLDDLTIYVNDVAISNDSAWVNVKEGDVVTIVFVKNYWAGIGFDVNVNITYKECVYGDVNGDGKVNVADANLVRRYAVKLIGEYDLNLDAANVNGDEKVNVADANLIRRFAVKLIDKFPVEE